MALQSMGSQVSRAQGLHIGNHIRPSTGRVIGSCECSTIELRALECFDGEKTDVLDNKGI